MDGTSSPIDGSGAEIIVVGCGYVGYPLALLAARSGYSVLGVDTDPDVVAAIQNGESVIDEAALSSLAASGPVRERLRAAQEPEKGNVFVVAVPTPLDTTRRAADVSTVAAAVRSIGPSLRSGNLVIIESTVPPGTCRSVVAPILAEAGLTTGIDIKLAHCPERVLPGASVEEMIENDRVIGGVDAESTDAAIRFYSSFVRGELIPTDDVTAEFCKLIENTYRDVNIALANQVADVAESFGVDADEAIALANRHPRVDLLQPGIGVGGHCIPLDPWFLINSTSPETVLIETARAINDERPQRVARDIRSLVAGQPGPVILLVGAAYKPNVEDTRESPALLVRELLLAQGIDVRVYDPLVSEYEGDIVLKATGADLVAILVPHQTAIEELRARYSQILSVLRTPKIVDFSRGRARPHGP